MKQKQKGKESVIKSFLLPVVSCPFIVQFFWSICVDIFCCALYV